MTLAGMPIDRFLEIDDTFERNIWLRVAERVIEYRRKIDLNRAQMIANAVGKMLSGK